MLYHIKSVRTKPHWNSHESILAYSISLIPKLSFTIDNTNVQNVTAV